jgi:transporter family protein
MFTIAGGGWVADGLLAAGFAALVAVLGRLGLAELDATVGTALRAAVMAVVTLTFAAATRTRAHVEGISLRAWLYIVLSGVAGAASWLCYFRALRAAPSTAAVAALDRTSVVLVFAAALAFLGEAFTWKAAAGAVLCAAGAALMVL